MNKLELAKRLEKEAGHVSMTDIPLCLKILSELIISLTTSGWGMSKQQSKCIYREMISKLNGNDLILCNRPSS